MFLDKVHQSSHPFVVGKLEIIIKVTTKKEIVNLMILSNKSLLFIIIIILKQF